MVKIIKLSIILFFINIVCYSQMDFFAALNSTLNKRYTRIDMFGESNLGRAYNEPGILTIDTTEKAWTLIWDNYNNDGYDNLRIGYHGNHTQDHRGIEGPTWNDYDTCHGPELQIARCVDSMKVSDYIDSLTFLQTDYVRLLKRGQGGSRLVTEILNADSSYWGKVRTSVTAINNLYGIDTLRTFMIIFLGINDAENGCDSATYYDSFVQLRDSIYALYNFRIPIFMPNIMDKVAYEGVNAAISALGSNFSDVTIIESQDASTQDAWHYDFDGLNLVMRRLLGRLIARLNYNLNL